MKKCPKAGSLAAGFGAGSVTGLFGGGGGMLMVPALTLLTDTKDSQIFPTSLSIMLPICIVSLFMTGRSGSIPWEQALPYLLGSGAGGIFAAIFSRKIPTTLLHRLLGILILWGGIRYLC